MNALFTGLAIVAVVGTLWSQRQELNVQKEELKLTRNELERTAKAQEQSQRALEEQVRLLLVAARLNSISSLCDTSRAEVDIARTRYATDTQRIVEDNFLRYRQILEITAQTRGIGPSVDPDACLAYVGWTLHTVHASGKRTTAQNPNSQRRLDALARYLVAELARLVSLKALTDWPRLTEFEQKLDEINRSLSEPISVNEKQEWRARFDEDFLHRVEDMLIIVTDGGPKT